MKALIPSYLLITKSNMPAIHENILYSVHGASEWYRVWNEGNQEWVVSRSGDVVKDPVECGI